MTNNFTYSITNPAELIYEILNDIIKSTSGKNPKIEEVFMNIFTKIDDEIFNKNKNFYQNIANLLELINKVENDMKYITLGNRKRDKYAKIIKKLKFFINRICELAHTTKNKNLWSAVSDYEMINSSFLEEFGTLADEYIDNKVYMEEKYIIEKIQVIEDIVKKIKNTKFSEEISEIISCILQELEHLKSKLITFYSNNINNIENECFLSIRNITNKLKEVLNINYQFEKQDIIIICMVIGAIASITTIRNSISENNNSFNKSSSDIIVDEDTLIEIIQNNTRTDDIINFYKNAENTNYLE